MSEQLIAVQAGVPLEKLGAGQLRTRDWVEVTKAASELSDSALFVDDRLRPSTSELRDRIRLWRSSIKDAEGVVPLVVIDPLDELRSSSGTARELELFRALSVDSKLCLLLGVRVPNGVLMNPEDLRPRSLSRAADVLALIHRRELTQGKNTPEPDRGGVDLIFTKNDLGPRTTVRLHLDPRTGCFTDPVDAEG